jgi:hypothetical protein
MEKPEITPDDAKPADDVKRPDPPPPDPDHVVEENEKDA